jgi:hypothetical protein
MTNVKRRRVALVLNATLLIAAATLPLEGTERRRCTIVTNGTVEVYLHELAHCNGWSHPQFTAGQWPPPEYLIDYPGQLTIIMSGADDIVTRLDTKASTEIVVTDEKVSVICSRLWTGKGIDISTHASKIEDIIGCAVRWE